MKEPGKLPHELESLVIAERNAPTGSPADHRRIRARLGIGLGVLGIAAGEGAASGGTATGGASAAGAGASALGGSVIAKLVVAGVALSAAAGGGYLLGRQHGSESAGERTQVAVEHTSPFVAPAPAPDVPSPALVPTIEDDVPVPTIEDDELEPDVEEGVFESPAVAIPSRKPRPDVEPTEDIEVHLDTEAPVSDEPSPAESALIVRAWRAVEQGNYVSAEIAIENHAKQFPDGALAEERDALRVRALVLSGERAQAEKRAHAFLKQFPRSVHAAAVERALAGGE